MINEPYVKKYENGLLVNPIQGMFVNPYENRRSRRSLTVDKPRFKGNGKNYPIVVTKTGKFIKLWQFVSGKCIEHYIVK